VLRLSSVNASHALLKVELNVKRAFLFLPGKILSAIQKSYFFLPDNSSSAIPSAELSAKTFWCLNFFLARWPIRTNDN
jgi:hypothetical protein